MDGYLVCFRNLAIANNAAMKMGVGSSERSVSARRDPLHIFLEEPEA